MRLKIVSKLKTVYRTRTNFQIHKIIRILNNQFRRKKGKKNFDEFLKSSNFEIQKSVVKFIDAKIDLSFLKNSSRFKVFCQVQLFNVKDGP